MTTVAAKNPGDKIRSVDFNAVVDKLQNGTDAGAIIKSTLMINDGFQINRAIAATTIPLLALADTDVTSTANLLRIRCAGTGADIALYDDTYSLAFKRPVLTASTTFTLPSGDGSSGQVLATDGSAVLSWVTRSTVIDHGALTGLADDDHTQYLLLAGRAGGQVITNVGTESILQINEAGEVMAAGAPLVVWASAAQTQGSSALVKFLMTNASSTRICLDIQNAGSGYGVSIAQSNAGSTSGAVAITNSGTGAGLSITQAGVNAVTNHALYIYSNAVQNAAELVYFDQHNASSTRPAFLLSNAGKGCGISLTQSGVLNLTQRAVYLYSNAAQVDSELLFICEDNAGSTANAMAIQNDGTGCALYVNQAGVIAGFCAGLYVTSNAAQVNSPLAFLFNDHAGSTASVLSLRADGGSELEFTNGTNYIRFRKPALAGNTTYTLPVADGTVGQALITSGAGVLSWATVSGSSPLTTEGDLYYYHTGANARLPIGANGYVLTSNGTDPGWAAGASQVVADVTLSVAVSTYSFTGLTGNAYRLHVHLLTGSIAGAIGVGFNNVYDNIHFYVGAGSPNWPFFDPAMIAAATSCHYILDIKNVAAASAKNQIRTNVHGSHGTGSAQINTTVVYVPGTSLSLSSIEIGGATINGLGVGTRLILEKIA